MLQNVEKLKGFEYKAQYLPLDLLKIRYLSRDRGLGSGRMASREEEQGCLTGGETKFRSREPDFLWSGSMPMAPCISLSMGQDPARPWPAGCSSDAMAPWTEEEEAGSAAGERGSCVGDTDGGERDFFFAAAPERSFRRPLLLFSFWEKNRKRQKGRTLSIF